MNRTLRKTRVLRKMNGRRRESAAQFLLSAIIFSAAFLLTRPALASVIVSVEGNFDTPVPAFDDKPGTYATLSKKDGEKTFQFFVQLKSVRSIESVGIAVKPKIDSALLYAGNDITTLNKVSDVFGTSAAGELHYIDFSFNNPFPARYINVVLLAKKAKQIQIYDISIRNAAQPENSILDISVAGITETSAEIKYRTSFPAVSLVRYSAERPLLNQISAGTDLATEHNVPLNGLISGTDYFYQIIVEKEEGGSKTSEVGIFRTSGDPPPEIRSIDMPPPGHDSARLDVKANTPVKWRLKYGIFNPDEKGDPPLSGAGVVEMTVGQPSDSASFELANLEPRTRYFIIVSITDGAGREAVSDLLGFDTAPENLALGKPVEGTFTNELDDMYIEKSISPIKRITDGREDYLTSFAKGYQTSDAPQWVSVDLGFSQEVGEIIIVWSDLAVPKDYKLSIGTDGKTWTTILKCDGGMIESGTGASEANRYSDRGDPLKQIIVPVNKALRHIKLEIPKDAPVESRFGWKTPILAEIKAYAPPKTSKSK